MILQKVLIAVLLAALLSGCSQQKKSSESDDTAEVATEALMDEAEETQPEQASRDYLARCNCDDCDDYIILLEQRKGYIARYYMDGEFGEFDVANVEFRIVDEERIRTTYEYVLISETGLGRVVLYTNVGMDRVETVIAAGVDQDKVYAEINCRGADESGQEVSPNIDLAKFKEIGYEDKGYGIWYTDDLHDSGAYVNPGLAEITDGDRFASKITLRGKELYLLDGDMINSYRDYDVTFQTETYTDGAYPVTEFAGYPSLTIWSEEYGWGGEIRHLDIEDRSDGLHYSFAVYSPPFESWDTFNLHYTYKPLYYSLIRPGYQDFEYGVSYTDTMMLLEYNDDYDYAYAKLQALSGRVVTLICPDPMDNQYKDRVFAVTWKFDTFYEAGRGEEPYIQESIVSWELTNMLPFELEYY